MYSQPLMIQQKLNSSVDHTRLFSFCEVQTRVDGRKVNEQNGMYVKSYII